MARMRVETVHTLRAHCAYYVPPSMPIRFQIPTESPSPCETETVVDGKPHRETTTPPPTPDTAVRRGSRVLWHATRAPL